MSECGRACEVEEALRAVELLRAVRGVLTLKEISAVTGLNAAVISRYINGHVLPWHGRAREILTRLLDDRVVRVILERALRGLGSLYEVGVALGESGLLRLVGEYARHHYPGATHVLTPEAGGIAPATAVALSLKARLVVARRDKPPSGPYLDVTYMQDPTRTRTLYVPARALPRGARVLIVDDFSVHGETLRALKALVDKAGATHVASLVVVGYGPSWKPYPGAKALLEIEGAAQPPRLPT